jgi:hypothetical protein
VLHQKTTVENIKMHSSEIRCGDGRWVEQRIGLVAAFGVSDDEPWTYITQPLMFVDESSNLVALFCPCKQS